MDGLTKQSVKKRLIVALVLAVIWTVLTVVLGVFKDAQVILLVLAPILMTWSFTTIFFWPKEFAINTILPPFKMWLHIFTFRFGEAIKAFFQPLVWTFKALIRSIKVIFWAFSSKE